MHTLAYRNPTDVSYIDHFSVVPLIRDSVGVLLMRTPKSLDMELPACYTRVSVKCSNLEMLFVIF